MMADDALSAATAAIDLRGDLPALPLELWERAFNLLALDAPRYSAGSSLRSLRLVCKSWGAAIYSLDKSMGWTRGSPSTGGSLSSGTLTCEPTGVVNIHVGELGCSLGSAFWELLQLEHGLAPASSGTGGICPAPTSAVLEPSSYFDLTILGRRIPRALFAAPGSSPTSCSPLDRSFAAPPSAPFHADSDSVALPSAQEVEHNVGALLEHVRRMHEREGRVDGVLLWHAANDGFGSCVGGELLASLREAFPKCSLVSVCCFPTTTDADVDRAGSEGKRLGALASVLSCNALHTHADTVLTFQADCPWAADQARASGFSVGSCFQHGLAAVMADLTRDMRMRSRSHALFPSLDSFLPPNERFYPGIHMLTAWRSSFTAGRVRGGVDGVSDDVAMIEPFSAAEATLGCFRPNASLVSFTPSIGGILGLKLFYNDTADGAWARLEPCQNTLTALKAPGLLRFIDWVPAGVRVARRGGVPRVQPRGCPFGTSCPARYVTVVAQTTAVRHMLDPIHRLADSALSSGSGAALARGFAACGVDQERLRGATADLRQRCVDYADIESHQPDDDDHDEGDY
jgi:hypothetical protein